MTRKTHGIAIWYFAEWYLPMCVQRLPRKCSSLSWVMSQEDSSASIPILCPVKSLMQFFLRRKMDINEKKKKLEKAVFL
jgi:hypothetical protein